MSTFLASPPRKDRTPENLADTTNHRNPLSRRPAILPDNDLRCREAPNLPAGAGRKKYYSEKKNEPFDTPISSFQVDVFGPAPSGPSTRPSERHFITWACRRALHPDEPEKGAIGICTLLTKSGPLSGLAGMLVGVSQALSLYLAQGCNPQTFIAGFALSIMATFWGVMIALLALFTARALWLPYLARRRHGLLDAAQEAMIS